MSGRATPALVTALWRANLPGGKKAQLGAAFRRRFLLETFLHRQDAESGEKMDLEIIYFYLRKKPLILHNQLVCTEVV